MRRRAAHAAFAPTSPRCAGRGADRSSIGARRGRGGLLRAARLAARSPGGAAGLGRRAEARWRATRPSSTSSAGPSRSPMTAPSSGAFGESDARGAAYVFVRSGDAWIEEQKLVASDGAELDKFGCVRLARHRSSPRRGIRGGRLSRRRLRLRQERQRLDRGAKARRERRGRGRQLRLRRLARRRPRPGRGVRKRRGSRRRLRLRPERQRLDRGAEARRERRGRRRRASAGPSRSPAIARWWGLPEMTALAAPAYVFVRSGSAWTEEQKLVANDGAAFDNFGNAVSLAGDRALVGAYWNDDFRGAAYVFVERAAARGPRSRSSSRATGRRQPVRQRRLARRRPRLIGAFADDDGRGAAYVFSRNGDVNAGPRSRGSSRATGKPTCSPGPSRSPPIEPWSAPSTMTSFAARPTSFRWASRTATRAPPMPTIDIGQDGGPIEAGTRPGSCIRGDECTSGHCEDGICCDRTCAANERCRAELKVSGEDGVCGPAKAAAPGAPCRFDVQCTSGHCSGADGVCADADAVPDGACTSGDACVSGAEPSVPGDGGGCGCRAGGSAGTARAPGLVWCSCCCSCAGLRRQSAARPSGGVAAGRCDSLAWPDSRSVPRTGVDGCSRIGEGGRLAIEAARVGRRVSPERIVLVLMSPVGSAVGRQEGAGWRLRMAAAPGRWRGHGVRQPAAAGARAPPDQRRIRGFGVCAPRRERRGGGGGLSARRNPEARLLRQRRADRLLGAGRPARQRRPGPGRGGAPERAVRPPRALRRPHQRRRGLRARLHSVVRRPGLPAAAHRRGHRSAARPLPRRRRRGREPTTTGSIS